LVVFYFVSIRNMEVGGSNPPGAFELLAKALALSVGGTAEPSVSQILIGLLAAAAGIAGLVLMRRERIDVWIFFAATVYASPLLVLFLRPSAGLFVRYFYINIVFFLLLLSYVLGRLGAAGRLGRVLCAASLACIVAGNFLRLREFSHGGRGQYRAAVRYMVEHTAGPVIDVETDHKRNELLLQFYCAYLPTDRVLNHRTRKLPPTGAAEWYLAHSERPGWQPADAIADVAGRPFLLAKVFRHSGLSGFDWALYHRSNRADSSAGATRD
jgi:hypothetical protein